MKDDLIAPTLVKLAPRVNSASAPIFSDTALSPEYAVAKLRRIQHHRVTLNDAQFVIGISSINKEQTNILAALTIKKPTLDTQLSLL